MDQDCVSLNDSKVHSYGVKGEGFGIETRDKMVMLSMTKKYDELTETVYVNKEIMLMLKKNKRLWSL